MLAGSWFLNLDPDPNKLPSAPAKAYLELDKSAAVQVGQSSSSIKRLYLVRWEMRLDFLQALLGAAIVVGGVGGQISRLLPDLDYVYPTYVCQDASLEPMGPTSIDPVFTPSAYYPFAKITADYKPADYNILADTDTGGSELSRFVTRTFEYSVDYLTISATGLKMVTSGRVITQPPGRIVPALQLSFKWRDVPTMSASTFFWPVNMSAAANLLGHVNSVAFDKVLPPGTVLFLGQEATWKPPRDNTFQTYHDLTLKFLYRNYGPVTLPGGTTEQAGHNYIYDTAGQRWDLLTLDGTVGAPRIYPSGDLNQLFTVAP